MTHSTPLHPVVAAGRRGRWLVLGSRLLLPGLLLLARPGLLAVQEREVRPPQRQSIAEALTDADGDLTPDRMGDTVIVSGVLTSYPIRIGLQAILAYMEDESAGVLLFTRDTLLMAGVGQGDAVWVRGVVDQHEGAEELHVVAIERVTYAGVPAPRAALATDLKGERYSGRLVRLEGVISLLPSKESSRSSRPRVFLSDRSGHVPVLVPDRFWAELWFVERLLRGGRVTVTGFASQSDSTSPYDAGYRLVLRAPTDVVFTRMLPYELLMFGGAFVALALAALYLWWRRRTAERRGREMAALVTQLEQAQRRLELSVSLLHATLDSTADGILVTDGQGKVVGYNRTFLEMWRIPEPVCAAGDEARLFDSAVGQLQDPEGFLARVRELYASPEAVGDDMLEFKDGRVFSRSSRPQRLGERVVGRVWSFHDVTQRIRIEGALQQSEAHYRSLVENSPYGICQTMPDGRFRAVNPALVAMLGYESDDELLAIDVTTQLYADPADRERLMEVHRDRRAGHRTAEVVWKRKDGTPIRVRTSTRVVEALDGQPELFETMVEDATERHTLEEQLRQAQKMEALGQLTGGIAHDFNNLLTVIIANAELVKDGLDRPDAELRESLCDLERSARRGAEMVRKLLAFGRRRPLERRPISLAQTIAEGAMTLRRILREDIEVRFALDDDVGFVNADAGAMEQILLNLATNAQDAMPGGGVLTVSLSRTTLDQTFRRRHGWLESGEHVVLSVMDTGSGMDAETLARVFDPFFTTKEVGKGSGLGLAMVYGLVQQHEGHVTIDSVKGRGTACRIYLPRWNAMQTAQAREAPAAPGGGHERILVVEDETAVRRSAERILQRYGYAVITATNGEEALEVIDAGQPVDLVVTDVVMPKLGGLGLYQALRERGFSGRVLFMSGYTAPDVGERVRLGSGGAFLAKPWTVPEFAAAVRGVLDRDEPTGVPAEVLAAGAPGDTPAPDDRLAPATPR